MWYGVSSMTTSMNSASQMQLVQRNKSSDTKDLDVQFLLDTERSFLPTLSAFRSNSLPSLQMNRVGSTEPLEKSWDIRNEDNISYHAEGALLQPKKSFLKHFETDEKRHHSRHNKAFHGVVDEWTLCLSRGTDYIPQWVNLSPFLLCAETRLRNSEPVDTACSGATASGMRIKDFWCLSHQLDHPLSGTLDQLDRSLDGKIQIVDVGKLWEHIPTVEWMIVENKRYGELRIGTHLMDK
ncbi:hypothetical protein Tco_0109049 [Tanacetum coccineum]